jgi:nitroimidazol reductase NimA-like FMN-containing flavoprotein (pyridoxamine 5'-phosphate oxidase superfamily)
MTQDEVLRQSIGRLLNQQVQCALATVSDGQPELHLMAFAFSPGLERVYLASVEQTRKVRNMRASPTVGLLWDNRTRQIQDHIDGVALSASGQAVQLVGAELAAAARALLERNSTLQALLDNPAVAIFAIDIICFRWVQGYGEVLEYAP